MNNQQKKQLSPRDHKFRSIMKALDDNYDHLPGYSEMRSQIRRAVDLRLDKQSTQYIMTKMPEVVGNALNRWRKELLMHSPKYASSDAQLFDQLRNDFGGTYNELSEARVREKIRRAKDPMHKAYQAANFDLLPLPGALLDTAPALLMTIASMSHPKNIAREEIQRMRDSKGAKMILRTASGPLGKAADITDRMNDIAKAIRDRDPDKLVQATLNLPPDYEIDKDSDPKNNPLPWGEKALRLFGAAGDLNGRIDDTIKNSRSVVTKARRFIRNKG